MVCDQNRLNYCISIFLANLIRHFCLIHDILPLLFVLGKVELVGGKSNASISKKSLSSESFGKGCCGLLEKGK